MPRRTSKGIENDFNAAKKFMKDNPSTSSFKGLAVGIGISESQLRTSFEKHPRVYASIKALIEANAEDSKAKKLAEKEALAAKKLADKEAKKAEKATSKSVKKAQATSSEEKRYVIDASITGTENLRGILNDILAANGSKIVLTNVTIQELDRMQKFHDREGTDARYILNLAAENPEHCICIRIDESVGNADECIVHYCADNNVVLLTSDKSMALNARSYGVTVRFLKQPAAAVTTSDRPWKSNNKSSRAKTNTLYFAKRIGDKMFVEVFHAPTRSVSLFARSGIEYDEGVYELHVGDSLFLATKKDGYLTFAHYRVTSLSEEDNCEFLYGKRIYSSQDISNLPKANYKSFMRAFKRIANF